MRWDADEPANAKPEARGLRAIGLARTRRRQTRPLLVLTTACTVLCVGGIVALFGFRRAPPRPIESPLVIAVKPGAPVATSKPLISLRAGAVLLDGTEVARTDAIAASGEVQRVDGLVRALKERPRVAGASGERAALLEVTADTPAPVVKSVFQTLLYAGYADVRFTGVKRPE